MGAAERNVAEGLMFSMGIIRPEIRGRLRLASILYHYLASEVGRSARIPRSSLLGHWKLSIGSSLPYRKRIMHD